MSAAPLHAILPEPEAQTESYTLLELVEAVSSVTDDDEEVVATVLSMLRSGRIALRGNFREAPLDAFAD